MNIISGIEKLKRLYPKPVIAIGVFDGLHRGHRQLIRAAVERARAIGGTAMVMTFSPHPVHVLRPEVHLPLLVSLEYRLRLFASLGVDVCVVMRFTKRFSRLTPEQFITKFLVKKIMPAEVIVGEDFRFGQNRAGTIEYFQKAGERHGFMVHAVHVLRKGKKTVSSTRIRQYISEGKLRQAARLLERPVSILGRVVLGDTRGRTLGYPTANINPSCEVLPPLGAYLVHVWIKGCRYHGMANIGQRPSFKKTEKINVEVHVFDFHKNLYGREILVEFLKKLRDERFFLSRELLIRQIKLDEKKARAWFAQKNPTL